MKKHIPNLLTLFNLLSGTIAVMFAVNNNLFAVAFFVLLGIFFDFFDGFAARVLNVKSELGLQLDSLADVVTSGVVPGVVMYQLLFRAVNENSLVSTLFENVTISGEQSIINNNFKFELIQFVPFIGLLLTLAAAYRLAKFNIDTRQTDYFIGLPTPAMALFITSLPLVLEYAPFSILQSLVSNVYILIVITLIFSYLMNSNIALFALKFNNFSFARNWVEVLFLIFTIVVVVLLSVVSIPVIILFYIVFSLFKTVVVHKK
ncbi:MAG: phosphatidylserine synthase [Flavobacteriales bacterium]|nr:MAG: phosphatidylserine synthase [Flavobacteriales bacterium]